MSAATSQYPNATFLDVKFAPLELVDVPKVIAAGNDSVVRLGVMQGEYRWHKHAHDGNRGDCADRR